jgi:aryl-alcohol dehydrogenase-like predicted oxidoreductase
MIYNRFGNTGMTVSRIAVGGFLVGKDDIEEAKVHRIIDAAIDGGVNLIDTADTYFDSELRIGRALKSNGKRDDVFLCTKLYQVHSNAGKLARNSRTNILRGIDNSLRRLQTDHVDAYLLHHPDSHAAVEETMRALDLVVKSGKARYVGCSNHYAWQIAHSQGVARQLGTEPFSIVQNCYNALCRVVEQEYLHFLRKFNLGMMVYSPLCVGLLTGEHKPGQRIAAMGQAGEFQRTVEAIGPGVLERIIHGLSAIAAEQGLTLSQLAILWLLAKPVVSAVLLGGTEPEHFRSIFEAIERPLDAAVVERIDALTAPTIHIPYRNQPEVTGGQ